MEEAFIKMMKTEREIVLGGRLRRIFMFSPVGFDRPGRCQVAAVLTGLQSTQVDGIVREQNDSSAGRVTLGMCQLSWWTELCRKVTGICCLF